MLALDAVEAELKKPQHAAPTSTVLSTVQHTTQAVVADYLTQHG
jgi:hypothetical protein